MNKLPNEMIFEIVKHLDGDEMVKFSMVNKPMYSMFENERKKLYKQRATKFNKRQFDLYMFEGIEKIYLRCLSCFRKFRVRHIDPLICPEELCNNCINVKVT